MNNLEEEYRKNYKRISELDNRIAILSKNSRDYKIPYAILLSMIPWVAGITVLPTLSETGLMQFLYSTIYATGSLVIGTVAQKVLFKNGKLRKKLQRFSTSTKEDDILSEKAEYEVEREKLKSRNKVLKKIIDNPTLETEDEFEYISIDKLNDDLKKKEEELNNLSVKKVINESISDKYGFLPEIALSSSIALLYYNMPGFLMSIKSGLSFSSNVLAVLAPAIICGALSGKYFIERDKLNNRIYERVSNDLNVDCYYDEEDLNKIINDIYDIRLQIDYEKNIPSNEVLKESVIQDENVNRKQIEETSIKEEKEKVFQKKLR